MRIVASLCIPLAAIGTVTLPVLGQEDALENALATLTGGERRTWVRERFEQFMAHDETCEQGEHWIFQATGNILIEKCIEGHVQRQTKTYVLLPAEDIDPQLLLDERTYDVIFYETDDWIEMTLRDWAERKDQPTTDRVFRFEPD